MNVCATENEDKKRYLKSYQASVRREKRILEEIQRLEMDKLFPSAVNDGMPKGNKKGDLSDYIVLMEEQIEKLKKERLKKAKAYERIYEQISEVEDDTEKELLDLRYIKGLKWEEISLEMDYSWKQVHRIHANALKHLQIK
jgi:DNA-directed RNA polymerase specialized sigma24 family protein